LDVTLTSLSVIAAHLSLAASGATLPPPGDQVKEWPLVGEKLYASWSAAASNLEGWLEANHEQVEAFALEHVLEFTARGEGPAFMAGFPEP